MILTNDYELLSAIRSRNEQTTGKIYNRYRNEFINFFRNRIDIGRIEVMDIYQDSFMEMCNKIYENRLNESNLTSSLKTYLFGIGKFKLNNTIRKNRRDVMRIFADVPDIKEDESYSEVEDINVKAALIRIGEPCHTILVKQYWEDKSTEEIANEMNYKNKETAKTQKYKCIQKLKNDLKDKIVSLN